MNAVSWQWVKANPDAAARRIRQLERENAALRDALDCIAGNHGERSPVTLTEAQEEARAALSARKEVKP